MTTAKLLYTSLFSAFLLAGCDGSQTKISQADQTELTQLREEKKACASEKAQMQESLTLKEKEKNEAVAELDQLKEEFQTLQDKSEAGGAKVSIDPLLKK